MAAPLSKSRRIAIAPESPFKTAGAYVNPKAYQNVTITVDRDMLPDERHLNTLKDQYVDHPGMHVAEASADFPLHTTSATDLNDVLTAALGEKVAASPLTFASASTNVSVTISAGVFDGIQKATTNIGTRYRPLKSVAGGTVGTWAIKTPVGETVSDVDNASDSSGTAYKEKPDGTVGTLTLEFDRAGQSGELKGHIKGAVPTELDFAYDLSKRIMVSAKFKGAAWDHGTAANVADPSTFSDQFLGWSAECAIQDLAVPVVLTEKRLRALSFKIGHEFIPVEGTMGLSGTTVPETPITGWIRSVFPNEVKFTIVDETTPLTTWINNVTNQTAYQFFANFMPGTPGVASSVKAISVWIPRIIATKAVPVDVNGYEAVEVTAKIEQADLAAADNLRRKLFLTFWG